jgi:hypothetical protein
MTRSIGGQGLNVAGSIGRAGFDLAGNILGKLAQRGVPILKGAVKDPASAAKYIGGTALGVTGLGLGIPALGSAYNWVDEYMLGGAAPFGVTPEQVALNAASRNAAADPASTGGQQPPTQTGGGQGGGAGQSGGTGQDTAVPKTFISDLIPYLQERGRSQDELQREQFELFKTQLSPEARARIIQQDLAAQLQLQEAAAQQALAKSEERTRREREIANINAWKSRDIAAMQRDALVSSSLANIAYAASTPNASVLQAMNSNVAAAAKQFLPGTAVI